MAKLKAPLMSLGASQKLGDALVFFAWKGLNCVREYVVPTNPNTALQQTQRSYITSGVAELHRLQTFGVAVWTPADVSAYALWAAVVRRATTWFNQVMKNWIDQNVAGLWGCIFCTGTTTPGVGLLNVAIGTGINNPTAGNFHYGTSRTNMPLTVAGAFAAATWTAVLPALTAGVKYFWQFRATAPAGSVGVMSGIYYGYPT